MIRNGRCFFLHPWLNTILTVFHVLLCGCNDYFRSHVQIFGQIETSWYFQLQLIKLPTKEKEIMMTSLLLILFFLVIYFGNAQLPPETTDISPSEDSNTTTYDIILIIVLCLLFSSLITLVIWHLWRTKCNRSSSECTNIVTKIFNFIETYAILIISTIILSDSIFASILISSISGSNSLFNDISVSQKGSITMLLSVTSSILSFFHVLIYKTANNVDFDDDEILGKVPIFSDFIFDFIAGLAMLVANDEFDYNSEDTVVDLSIFVFTATWGGVVVEFIVFVRNIGKYCQLEQCNEDNDGVRKCKAIEIMIECVFCFFEAFVAILISINVVCIVLYL